MTQGLLIGFAAGLAAALLFAAPLSGAGIALALFPLAGLPIAIAGLGWTLVAAIAAAVVGAAAVIAFLSGSAAAIFVLVFCVPLCWVIRLAPLSRPIDTNSPNGPQEWYPLGQMLFNLAILAALGIVLSGFIVGFDANGLASEFADALATVISNSAGTPVDRTRLDSFASFYVTIMPFIVGMLVVGMLVFDLWLGAVVARMSGRGVRPRDRLWTVSLPQGAVIGLGVALVLSFVAGPLGEVARVFAGVFACSAAMVGLAVMHAVTAGNNARIVILVAAYTLLFVFAFPIVLFALIGVAENFFNFRARRFGAAPPST